MANLVRLLTRYIWVSTAITGQPNAVFNTTFAVLRPTPGNASKASRFSGTTEPCKSINILQAL